MIFVHKTAVLEGKVDLGEGSSVWPNAVLRGDEAPIKIGKNTSIQDNAVVHGKNVGIGDFCTIGHGAVLHGCRIGSHVLVGMGAIVLDGARIGSYSVIGAGAVVPPNAVVPEKSVVMGVPAKVVRKAGEKDLELIEESWKAYEELSKKASGSAAEDTTY